MRTQRSGWERSAVSLALIACAVTAAAYSLETSAVAAAHPTRADAVLRGVRQATGDPTPTAGQGTGAATTTVGPSGPGTSDDTTVATTDTVIPGESTSPVTSRTASLPQPTAAISTAEPTAAEPTIPGTTITEPTVPESMVGEPSLTMGSPTPTPSDSAQESTVPDTSDTAVPVSGDDTVILPRPPAVVDSSVPTTSWLLAILAILASIGVLLRLRSRPGQRPVARDVVPVPSGATEVPPAAGATFAALESVGEAMLDAGYPVVSVQSALEDIARVNGHPSAEVLVFPTALIISTRNDGQISTGAVSTGSEKLLLHQVDTLDRLVDRARAGLIGPDQVRAGVLALRSASPPYPRGLRIVAYSVLCAALAVFLGGSWAGVLFAAAVGTVVGVVLALTESARSEYGPLVMVGLAFGVSTATFLVSRMGLDTGILPSLIAPLVILLPGGLLTTGVIELAAGQMMSGAGRLALGFMRLILLAAGLVAGALLVGVPRIELTEAHTPLGPAAPWIAVAVFGIAIMVHQGGRVRSIPWVVMVLYVAYGAQVLGSIFFGGVLSAFIGALVMTPVAIVVARHPTGPASMVSFLPTFWLLVPGALGLVGITNILTGDGPGATTLVTTVATMVAIALGILTGSALSTRLYAYRGDLSSQDADS